MRWVVVLCVVWSLVVAQGMAQSAPGLWKVERLGETVYAVKLSAIASASLHEYVVGGTVRVTEVTIGTLGSTQARFYHLQPVTATSGGGPLGLANTLTQRGQQIAERAAEVTGAAPVWRGVVKDYPTTTHAHTVEYRVESLQKLQELLKSVVKALETDRPESFKLD